MTDTFIHFVTGRLAEQALRNLLENLAPHAGFRYTVDVLPITVAALMSPSWILRHIKVPARTTQVMIPGYCSGDLTPLQDAVQVPVVRGPRDLRQLPRFFGRILPTDDDLGEYSIEIIAEINHARRLERNQLLDQARQYVQDGADVVDIGCEPGDAWLQVGDSIKALRDEGIRVSIDSFNPDEIAPAVAAGAELVLSVNSSNRAAALDWGCEVVVIPDDIRSLSGFAESVDYLEDAGVSVRLDPVVEPIGFGFAASLVRYFEVRQDYPDSKMMMGIGNLTELTDADSAAINVLLLGFCQELNIQSVLTTQVISWARTSIRECDLARRLVHYAIHHHVPPKHIEPRLVMLRDETLPALSGEEIENLAKQIKDKNFRIFSSNGSIHLLNSEIRISDRDPFVILERLLEQSTSQLSPSHLFYLGYELAKAEIAIQLDKDYQQDNPLNWGYLSETNDRRS